MKPSDSNNNCIQFLNDSPDGAAQLEIIRHFKEWREKQPYPFALPNRKLMIPTPDGIRFVELNQVIYLQAEGSYTYLYLANKEKLVVSDILKAFDQRLKQPPFIRTHRSYIVNLNQATHYLKGRKGTLLMSNGHKVRISVRKRESFARIMKAYFY